MINRNHQSIINGPPTGHQDINSMTTPLRAIRRASCHHATERSYERSVERAVIAEAPTNRHASHRAAAGQEPSTKRSVKRAVAAEPGMSRRSSHKQDDR